LVVAMWRRRQRELLLVAAAATAAGAIVERRHMRRIASDPERAVLSEPPVGRPLDIRSADGTALHVEVFGTKRPDMPDRFVLAHGWTETLRFWSYVIRDLALERGFEVIAYDLRGHGESGPAAGGDYSIARFGEDLEAVLDACLADDGRAVVVGHSLGAMSIAAWAERHQVTRRASAAALINTGVGDLIAEQLLIPVPWIARALNRAMPPRRSLGLRAPLPRFSTPLTYGAIRYAAFGPAATPAQIAFYEQMLIGCRPDARADTGIALSELELRQALPRLTIPTLVIAGDADKLTPPAHARRIAEELPMLERLVVLPATGHMAPLERPQRVCDALADLAGGVARGENLAA
jgi:pimeloyl-ACP methyl ester carboxylesterase